MGPNLEDHQAHRPARTLGKLPEWHPAYPKEAWLFVDEVGVE